MKQWEINDFIKGMTMPAAIPFPDDIPALGEVRTDEQNQIMRDYNLAVHAARIAALRHNGFTVVEEPTRACPPEIDPNSIEGRAYGGSKFRVSRDGWSPSDIAIIIEAIDRAPLIAHGALTSR